MQTPTLQSDMVRHDMLTSGIPLRVSKPSSEVGGRVSEETFGGVSAFRVYQSGSPVATREPRALEMLANVLGLKFSAVSTSTF